MHSERSAIVSRVKNTTVRLTPIIEKLENHRTGQQKHRKLAISIFTMIKCLFEYLDNLISSELLPDTINQ